MLIWLVLNGAFWTGVTLLVRNAWRASPLDQFFATTVAGFTAVIVTLEMLSVAGQIGTAALSVVAAGVLVAGVVSARPLSPRAQRPDGDSCGPPAPGPSRERAMRIAAATAGLAAAWACLDYLLFGLLWPVLPVSDAPIYHLPFAIRWWKSGTLELVSAPFGEEAATYFPSNGELWLTWLLATDDGGTAAKVGQWPFLIIGASALFALARQRGAGAGGSVLPAGLWACCPLVLAQSALANVDLIWAAFYLIAVYFVSRYAAEVRAGRPAHGALLWASLAMGIVLGTKFVCVLFIAPLVGAALVLLAKARRPHLHVALLFGGLALPAAYWYARNALVTANPVYPLTVSAFGEPLLVGWYDRGAMLATGYHVRPEDWPVLARRLVIVSGPVMTAAMALGVLTDLGNAILRRWNRSTSPAAVLPVCLVLFHFAVYWWVVPYNTQERFLLPALGLAALPVASLVEGRPWLCGSAAAILATYVCGVPGAGLGRLALPLRDGLSAGGLMWLAGVVPLTLALALVAWHRWKRTGPVVAAVLVTAGCAVCALPAAASLSSRPDRYFYPRGGFADRMRSAWLLVERESGPAGTRVAYAGTNLPYYLYASGLRNDVRYVNVNAHPNWLPHDYHRAAVATADKADAESPWPKWARRETDFAAWLSNLRRARVELLVAARENRHGHLGDLDGGPPPFPIEKYWADAHPDAFERIGPSHGTSGDPSGTPPWVHVYRVKPSE